MEPQNLLCTAVPPRGGERIDMALYNPIDGRLSNPHERCKINEDLLLPFWIVVCS